MEGPFWFFFFMVVVLAVVAVIVYAVSTTRRRPDDEVRNDVSGRLTQHMEVDASRIQIHVRNGIVTLSGMVPAASERRMASKLTKSVRGVRSVKNDLRTETELTGGRRPAA